MIIYTLFTCNYRFPMEFKSNYRTCYSYFNEEFPICWNCQTDFVLMKFNYIHRLSRGPSGEFLPTFSGESWNRKLPLQNFGGKYLNLLGFFRSWETFFCSSVLVPRESKPLFSFESPDDSDSMKITLPVILCVIIYDYNPQNPKIQSPTFNKSIWYSFLSFHRKSV